MWNCRPSALSMRPSLKAQSFRAPISVNGWSWAVDWCSGSTRWQSSVYQPSQKSVNELSGLSESTLNSMLYPAKAANNSTGPAARAVLDCTSNVSQLNSTSADSLMSLKSSRPVAADKWAKSLYHVMSPSSSRRNLILYR